MVWDICSKQSTVVVIFYVVVINVYIINESTSIPSHSCGSIDDWYERISMHDIKEFFSGRMLVMFEEVKIKVAHNVARILCHLLQDRMHCVVEIHNVTIWRAVNSSNYVFLTVEMKFSKYTFNMIINYIKFTEFSTCNFFCYIQRHTASPSHSPGQSNMPVSTYVISIE